MSEGSDKPGGGNNPPGSAGGGGGDGGDRERRRRRRSRGGGGGEAREGGPPDSPREGTPRNEGAPRSDAAPRAEAAPRPENAQRPEGAPRNEPRPQNPPRQQNAPRNEGAPREGGRRNEGGQRGPRPQGGAPRNEARPQGAPRNENRGNENRGAAPRNDRPARSEPRRDERGRGGQQQPQSPREAAPTGGARRERERPTRGNDRPQRERGNDRPADRAPRDRSAEDRREARREPRAEEHHDLDPADRPTFSTEPRRPAPIIEADDDIDRPVHFEEPPLAARDPDGEDIFLHTSPDASSQPSGQLANVAGVKFADAGSIHEYDAGDTTYARGDRVIVDTERGPVIATIAVGSRRRIASGGLRHISRRAAAEDEAHITRNAGREHEALSVARDRARDRKLPIKVIRAEYGLSGGRLLVYFASEERVDSRELARDLSQRLRARVDLKQVGARDEAKMVGGIGSCGRELCCSTFLPSFAPVSIKMAKDQGLVLNPTKVAGQCGRLKCCLVYEQDLYVEMKKTLPKVGKRVRTPGGDGKVIELDVLRQRVRVLFEEGGSETFPGNVIEVLAPPTPGSAPPAAPANS